MQHHDVMRKLFRAVVCQAINDLSGKSKVCNQDKQQAFYFLTDNHGQWKRSRHDICDAINICPDRLRKNVLKMMSSREDLIKYLWEMDYAKRAIRKRGVPRKRYLQNRENK